MTPEHLKLIVEKHFRRHKDFADSIGYSEGMVTHWLQGKHPIPFLVAKHLESLETMESSKTSQSEGDSAPSSRFLNKT